MRTNIRKFKKEEVIIMETPKLTLLTERQLRGNSLGNKLKIFPDSREIRAAMSDLCILTGCMVPTEVGKNMLGNGYSNKLQKRPCWYWTKNHYGYYDDILVVKSEWDWLCTYKPVEINTVSCNSRYVSIRPVIKSKEIYHELKERTRYICDGTYEVEYGEYPQWAVHEEMQEKLEEELAKGTLNKTGKIYTFDSTRWDNRDTGFQGVTYDEYEYLGKKYIRIKANQSHWTDAYREYGVQFDKTEIFVLSNGIEYNDGDYVWVEVSPVKWLLDKKKKTLVSNICLVSGIQFNSKDKEYNSHFEESDMYAYMQNYLAKELVPSVVVKEETTTRKTNLEEVKTEDNNIKLNDAALFTKSSQEKPKMRIRKK